MDLKEAIYTRRAVRDFTSQPVDHDTLRHPCSLPPPVSRREPHIHWLGD